MQRIAILLFGLIAYAVFFGTFLYLIAFVGNLQQTALAQSLPWLPELVPHSIDAGRPTGPVALAVAVNLGLIALFGLQHSVMARIGFKDWLKQKLPAAAERSVYVLLASLMLILLFWQWRPIPEVIWSAESGLGQAIGWTVFAAGFAMVLLATFLIDHFDLFGLKQVWNQFVGRRPEPPRFVTPLFYRLVRHPLYLGFILAFWGGPVMSVGGLLFAAAMTGYILIAIQLEERDLIKFLGADYEDYRQRVPMLVPGTKRRQASQVDQRGAAH
ncbi:isoprenylcysteine carboxylmethyltransferase family protein [Wenzhouxiangella sp. XN201]|uniref:methanethiol S-methyltransferase n=1 Tax=Wenzhouxiangella sp. XN201 TaxID=2710755 RepID=UPI0013C78024|nr:methanethiol S-methyltransferase [Wenzhouxiangella sp. XN201]NEZ04721.1 isoprenylcysteine carboxylmethyltransferase family protein [Wenzhouxiangella sp. XN201]